MKKLTGIYRRGEVWWLTFRHNGEKKFVSLQTADYAEAVKRAVKVKGAPVFARTDRISEARVRFLADKMKTGIYSRHSGEWAETPLKKLETFLGNMSVGAIKQQHLADFAAHLRAELADTSAASYMRAVRSFFSWLEKKREILASPWEGLKLPKVADAARMKYCDAALRDRLIGECADWDLRFILFAGFHAGLRRMEISEAVPEWFDLVRGFVSVERTAHFVPKDRERRTVPLTREFAEFLGATPLPGPFVLKPHVRHGKALYRYDFRAPFEAYMKAQGCPWVTPHVMRHTFATLYVSHGGSLYRLAKYLGDTPETTEKHYAHLSRDREDIERGHITSSAAVPASLPP